MPGPLKWLKKEKNVHPKSRKGPVDYMLLYEGFNICVVEAKKGTIEAGVNQNIAMMVASREDYCNNRKCPPDGISDIPS